MKDIYHDKKGRAINLPKVTQVYTKPCGWCRISTKTSSNLGSPICNKCMQKSFGGIF